MSFKSSSVLFPFGFFFVPFHFLFTFCFQFVFIQFSVFVSFICGYGCGGVQCDNSGRLVSEVNFSSLLFLSVLLLLTDVLGCLVVQQSCSSIQLCPILAGPQHLQTFHHLCQSLVLGAGGVGLLCQSW